MGVDVQLVEGNIMYEMVPDMHNALSSLLQSHSFPDTKCLQFIDPYGTTRFNQLQIPVLIEEFKMAMQEVSDKEMRDQLDKELALIEKAKGRDYACIDFEGD